MNQKAPLVKLLLALLMIVGAWGPGPTGAETQTTEAPSRARASDLTTPPVEAALPAPESSPAQRDNDEGVGYYRQGQWDMAKEYFRIATMADPSLAEAHYNLGLALDKLGKPGDATAHFQRALALAPDNPAIRNSAILKAHLGM